MKVRISSPNKGLARLRKRIKQIIRAADDTGVGGPIIGTGGKIAYGCCCGDCTECCSCAGTTGSCTCCSGSCPNQFVATLLEGPTSDNCIDCESFPTSYTLTFQSDNGDGQCIWKGTFASVCGATTAVLTLQKDTSADFQIGTSDHAYYNTSGFFCTTTSSLDLISEGADCISWPLTVDIDPV